jgi:hypothetical protein
VSNIVESSFHIRTGVFILENTPWGENISGYYLGEKYEEGKRKRWQVLKKKEEKGQKGRKGKEEERKWEVNE